MKLHFPGLDLLRIYAALSVVVWHTNVFLELPAAASGWLSGWDAVTLFFTLSGFLITYLLLVERKNSNQINVQAFYIRRALRIWPVYYLAIVIAVFLIGDAFRSLKDVLLTLVFLPNLALHTPVLAYLWSIGTEEQFYLLYPQLFRRVGLVKLCCCIIGVRWLLILISTLALWSGISSASGLYNFLIWNRFDAMAVGALFAYALYHQLPLLKWFYRAFPIIGLLFGSAVFSPSPIYISTFHDTAFAMVCGAVIIYVIRFPELERSWTRWAGNISYGVYMYHTLVIYMLPAQAVHHGTVMALTVLAAAASYHFFEKPFLSLKKRWSPDLATA